MTTCVITAHPDDEILGCGGTMEIYSDIHVLILAEGAMARVDASRAQVEILRECAKKANDYLGVESLEFGGFPDNKLDSIDLLSIIQAVELFLCKHKPDTVLTHYWDCLNIDHRITAQAVMTACRPVMSFVERLLHFEVPSATEWQIPYTFSPNYFQDISHTLHVKLKALEFYESEMRDFPHPRSYKAVEHLARWRGATVGVEAAEAFMVGRLISK